MVTITDSSLRNTVYQNVYNLINSNKGSFGASSTPTLYGGYPDVKSISYPNIVLMPIDVNEDSYTIDTDRSTSNKMITVTIEVYSKKNQDLDIIADGITHMFRQNQIAGMFLTGVAENMQFVSPNELKLKSKVLNFTFMRR